VAGDRSPEQIQGEIVARTSPKRLAADGKAKALEFAMTPKGKAIIGGVGAVVALLIVRKIRSHG
jgi:hypothetical protein